MCVTYYMNLKDEKLIFFSMGGHMFLAVGNECETVMKLK